jgi:hypothetical protein
VSQAATYFALAFVTISPAWAQPVVAHWFPIHTGDRWIYQHETRDETGLGAAHLEIHHWKTEKTVAGSWNIPEGTLAGINVRLMEGAPPTGRAVDPNPAYLIRGDCAYLTYVEWNPRDHQLTPAFRQHLLAGHLAPDFCFPLVVGKTWGAPHWGDWRPPSNAKDWRVQSASGQPATFHLKSISSYPGSGQTVDIWFEKGAGIVRELDIHHGTIGEERTRLVRFEPAPRR